LEKRFDGSLVEALQTVYSNHKWTVWRFHQNVPYGFWNTKENQKEFMDWLRMKLGHQAMENLYEISQKEIIDNGGGGLLSKHKGSRLKIAKSVYPEYKWLMSRFKMVIGAKYWHRMLG